MPDRVRKGAPAKLIAAAERNITDAQLKGLSHENRFDAACKAIMQLAMVALNANGYRTLTSKPGHHQTAIQTLPLTVGLAQSRVIVLDALRKQRNLSDYAGELVPASAATECLASANELRAAVRARLNANRPELLWRQTAAFLGLGPVGPSAPYPIRGMDRIVTVAPT